MTEKPYTCMVDGCGKRFASQAAKNSHRKMKHGKARPQGRSGYQRQQRPLAGMSPRDVYDFVDAMDLPDGAHWVMIEELSGLEPGDFAE
jgi:hypothetical protein